jgi:hypothetical protein
MYVKSDSASAAISSLVTHFLELCALITGSDELEDLVHDASSKEIS